MASNPLIHSALLSRLVYHFYPSEATIQQYTATADSYGAEVRTWADVVDLKDLPCAVVPSQRLHGSATSPVGGTVIMSTHRIALAGHYPMITPGMRAVVGGVAYDIMSVEHDSHEKMTSLGVQVAS